MELSNIRESGRWNTSGMILKNSLSINLCQPTIDGNATNFLDQILEMKN